MPNPLPSKLSAADYAALQAAGYDDARALRVANAGISVSFLLGAATGDSQPIEPETIIRGTSRPAAPRGAASAFVQGQRRLAPGRTDEAKRTADDALSIISSPGGSALPLTSTALRGVEDAALSEQSMGSSPFFTRMLKVQRGEVPPESVGSAPFFSMENVADTVGALLPQRVSSPDQQQRQASFLQMAGDAALSQVRFEVRQGDHPGVQLADVTPALRLVRDRREAILSGEVNAALQSAITPAERAQRRVPQVETGPVRDLRDAFSRPGALATPAIQAAGDAIASDVRDIAGNVGTTGLPTGSMVEGTVPWVGRLLSTPTSAAVGTLDPGTSVAMRIQEGEGFVAGGRDLGGGIATALGAEEATVESAKKLGAGLGLVGELFVPFDLGIGDAATAGRQAAKTFTLTKGAGADLPQSLRLAIHRALVPERWNTANSEIIKLLSVDPAVIRAADDVVEVLKIERVRTDATPSTIDDAIAAPGRTGADFKDADEMLEELLQLRMLDEAAVGRIAQAGRTVDALARELQPLVDVAAAAAKREAGRMPGTAGDPAILKQWQDDSLRLTLATESAAKRVRGAGIQGEKVRLSPRLVAEQGVARKLFRDFRSTPLGRVSAELAKNGRTYRMEDGRMNIAEVLKALDIQPRTFANQVGSFKGMSQRSIDEQLRSVDIQQYNQGALDAFERHALNSRYRVEQVRPDYDMTTARGRSQKAAQEQLVAPELDADEVKRVLTPMQLRPGKLREWFNTNINPIEDSYQHVDPALRPLVEELALKWGGLEQEFRAHLRLELRGSSPPEKFGGVLLDSYDSPEQMVADILANYYGGYESMGELVFTTAGERLSKSLGATPALVRKEMRRLFVGIHNGLSRDLDPNVGKALRELFDIASNPGVDSTVLLASLIRALRSLDGVPLSDIGGVVRNAENIKPIFTTEQIPDLLASSYCQHRAGQMIGEVFTPRRMADAGISPYGPNGPAAVANLKNSINQGLVAKGLRPLTDEDAAALLAESLGISSSFRTGPNFMALEVNNQLLMRPGGLSRFRELGYSDEAILSMERRADRMVEMAGTPAEVRTNYNETLKSYINTVLNNQSGGPAARLTNLGVDAATRLELLSNLDLRGLTEVLARTKANVPTENRWLVRLATTLDTRSKLARWTKGGMLSGRLAPNAAYMGVNYLTAPSIIFSTLGTAAAARAAARLAPIDFGLNRSMSFYYGYGDGLDIVVRAPTGVVYTAADIAEVLPRVSSQAGYELNDEMIRSMRAYTGLEGRNISAPGATSLADMQQSSRRRRVRAWTGLDVDPSVKDVGVGVNVFNEFAQGTDLYFRAGVLKDALASGSSMDEAVKLANEALYDYSSVSQIERNTIGRVWWFWSFQREAMRNSAINMLEAPERLRFAYQATKIFEDDAQYHVATKDYLALRPVLRWMEDNETRRRYATFGASVPMLDAMADLVDLGAYSALTLADFAYVATGYDADPTQMRLPLPVTGDPDAGLLKRTVQTGSRAVGRAGSTAAQRFKQHATTVLGQSSPLFSWASEALLEVRIQGDETRPVSTYLNPKWMALISLTPGAMDSFNSLVGIEAVPPTEIRAGQGTFNGKQWRIIDTPGGKMRWSMMQYGMMFAGVERTIRDYSPTFYKAIQGLDDDLPIQVETGMVDNAALDELLRLSGWAVNADIRTTTEQRKWNARDIEYLLKDATPR